MKIEGLEKLVNLDDLYLSDNGIQEVEGLENNVSNSRNVPKFSDS